MLPRLQCNRDRNPDHRWQPERNEPRYVSTPMTATFGGTPRPAKRAAIATSTTATPPGMKLARPRRIGTPSARIQAGDTNAWTGPRTEATSGHPHLYRCEKSSERSDREGEIATLTGFPPQT